MTSRQRSLVLRAALIMLVAFLAAIEAGLSGNMIAIYAVIVLGTLAETVWGVLPLVRERTLRRF